MRRSFFLVLSVIFLTSSLHAQWTPELDAWIEKARADWEAPGVAVTVVQDGKLLVAKGYGVRTLGRPELVDAHTVFDIASLSKSFTAAAAAILVDEGKMAWDDPVRKHLPGFTVRDPYRTQSLTMRDLLAHRAGLEQGNFVFIFSNYDTAEIVRRMGHLEERQPFRAGNMIYSNLGYATAGHAIQSAAGMPFADFVRTRLVEPLGMSESTVAVQHDTAANHADGHTYINDKHVPIRARKALNALGANSVNSTATDIANWLLFQMGDGTWQGKRIISAAAMEEMHSPQMIIPTTPEMRAGRGVNFFAAYGLGWQVMDYRGRKMLWHSGGADGMPTYMAILPNEKIGVCVMVNTWSAPILHGIIAGKILNTLLGIPDLGDPAEALAAHNRNVQKSMDDRAAMEKARVKGTKPSRPLESYAGSYEDEPHGTMLITHDNGKLSLQFAGSDMADLEHWQYDTFRVRWRDRTYEFFDTFATFMVDAQGNPKSFEMRLNRDTIEAKRIK
jgi:CubicO group peptidase (beta-lactamase class C family)